MRDTLVIHETVKEAYDASGGPEFIRPRMVHTSLGAAITGGPFGTVIYTHAAVMVLCQSHALRDWAECTVTSRVKP